jgi:hypothetical protein
VLPNEVDVTKHMENRRQKRQYEYNMTDSRPASAGVASVASNKFAKSKSRIFNFFR